MKKSLILLSSIFWLLVCPLSPEETGEKEDETPIPEHHLVITPSKTLRAEQEVGNSVSTLLSGEETRTGNWKVVEALKEVPGLTVNQNGGPGQTAGVMIRGGNSEHSLVMLDGFKLNDPTTVGRTFDFADLNFGNVQRVEVVRGPLSTLYGSDALGGVINLITCKGNTSRPRFSFSAEGGMNSTFRGSAGISGAAGRTHYSLELSHLTTGGISAAAEKYGNTEADGYRHSSLTGRFGYTPRENLEFSLITRFSAGRVDLDNGGGVGMDDPNYTQDSQSWLLGARARVRYADGKWEQDIRVSCSGNDRRLENPVDELHPLDSATYDYHGGLLNLELNNRFRIGPRHQLQVGLGYERENGDALEEYQSMWGAGSSRLDPVDAGLAGVFLHDTFQPLKNLHVDLGLRLDHHSTVDYALTYNLALSYLLEETGTQGKFSLGTGFKAPSLYHLYAPASAWGPIGNADLQPEQSLGWDLGIRQSLFGKRLILGCSYFQTDYSELIDFAFGIGYVNVKEAIIRGLEFGFDSRITNDLNLKGNYTYMQAENSLTGEALLRRPEHQGNLRVRWDLFNRVTLDTGIHYRGECRDVFPYPTLTTAPAYTLVDFGLSYHLNSDLDLFVRADNLLDVEYEPALGFGGWGFSVFTGLRGRL